jgi:hypothetical protein
MGNDLADKRSLLLRFYHGSFIFGKGSRKPNLGQEASLRSMRTERRSLQIDFAPELPVQLPGGKT